MNRQIKSVVGFFLQSGESEKKGHLDGKVPAILSRVKQMLGEVSPRLCSREAESGRAGGKRVQAGRTGRDVNACVAVLLAGFCAGGAWEGQTEVRRPGQLQSWTLVVCVICSGSHWGISKEAIPGPQ